MVNLGGGFQSFSIRVPLIQICTRLDLLTDKLDRCLKKHKEKTCDHHAAEARRVVRA